MAYSRWGNSRWYTYWSEQTPIHFKLPTKRLKRKQVFQIEDFCSYSFTYGELEDLGMGMIWNRIKTFYWHDHEDCKIKAKKPSEAEMRELIGYVEQWRADVDDHFKLINFFKHEWYIPLRNKIWKRIIKK